MDFSKLELLGKLEGVSTGGSYECMQEECAEIVAEAFLNEETGVLTYRCSKGHTSELELF